MLRYRHVSVFVAILASMLFLAGPAQADEVILKNGLVISGKVTVEGDTVRVERPGGTVTYSKDLVKKDGIKKSKTVWDIYADKRKALKDKDAAGCLALADWCADNAMPKKERELVESVLEFEPDNAKARARLGYIKDEKGTWVLAEEYYKSKGYVKHRGQWMKPEDKAKLVAAEAEAAEKWARASARAERAKRKTYSRRRYEPGEYIGISYGSSDRRNRPGGYIWSYSGYYYRNWFRSRNRYAYPYGYGYPHGYPRYGVPHPLTYGPTRIRITRPTTKIKMAEPGPHYKRTRVGKGWKYVPQPEQKK
ncbi:MAG: hypothetical protein E3J72_13405 [Planctomycetota bacterium]|nr:MAG: hypothetical protein E3J72_13405 [Planctomycetota bacterium]